MLKYYPINRRYSMITMTRRLLCANIFAGSMLATSSQISAEGRPMLLSAYTEAWSNRDLAAILDCVHPDIEFVGPNVRARGRSAYSASTQRFLGLLEGVVVRARHGTADTAMIAYDFICKPPVGRAPTAELVTFRDGLVGRSEIFFDTRPFDGPRPRCVSNPS